MKKDYFEKCKQYYKENIQEGTKIPLGCSSKEIQDIEIQNNFVLPLAYKQFLSWMGRDKAGVFVGSNIFFDDIVSNTKYLEETLKECQIDFQHKGRPLCFYSHQGYIYAWFYIPYEAEDPTCFLLVDEGLGSKVEKLESFSEFILGGL